MSAWSTPVASSENLKQTVSSWSDFRRAWNGVHNFLMTGECVPFSFAMPPIEQIVEEVRRDEDVHILSGAKGSKLDKTDISSEFRALPVEQAVVSPFQMSHFKLRNFYGEGQLFHGFEEQVMQPWQESLRQAGFTWTRCYPILFISGPHCATNYHMDASHVLAWQIGGTKFFSGLKDPQRWAPLEARLDYAHTVQPDRLTEADALSYEMTPGTVLWNCLLTPHWVSASDEISYCINLSHGGLRFDGQLARHEAELEEERARISA